MYYNIHRLHIRLFVCCYSSYLAGFFKNPNETSDIASSIKDVGELCFVPAFHGLQEPVEDLKAGCGFIGDLLSSGLLMCDRIVIIFVLYFVIDMSIVVSQSPLQCRLTS